MTKFSKGLLTQRYVPGSKIEILINYSMHFFVLYSGIFMFGIEINNYTLSLLAEAPIVRRSILSKKYFFDKRLLLS